MKRIFFQRLLMVSISALFLPFVAFADDPSIVSFKASDSSMNSGQPVTFSWTLANAGGYSFVVPCSAGTKVKKENGTLLACDTPISTTKIANDSLILFFYNASGSAKNMSVRLTPKTASGVDYSAAAQERGVLVNTVAQPIMSFISSEPITSSGKPLTISWTSQVVEGVNLQIDCHDDIKVSSSNYPTMGFLPCGKILFPIDLAPSSSLSLSFFNPTSLPISYSLKLYPAIVPHTSYDGGHAVVLPLTVASDILPDPIITFFTASTSAVNSGDKVTLSWASKNAIGINMKFSCNAMIKATSTQNSSLLFPCNDYMFNPLLNSTGQVTFSFVSTSHTDESITLTAIPSKQKGFYDAVRSKSFSLLIHPPIAVSSPSPSLLPSISPTSSPLPPPGSSSVPTGSPFIKSKIVFTQFLRRGSQGTQVSALQEFLKRDVTIYPEGIVIGYFGPATERAVQRFQKKYNLVTSGIPATTGYGVVGPKTRKMLNALP